MRARAGTLCELLAYPFSSYDRRVKEFAKAGGYAAAVILDGRIPIPRRSVPLLPAQTRSSCQVRRLSS